MNPTSIEPGLCLQRGAWRNSIGVALVAVGMIATLLTGCSDGDDSVADSAGTTAVDSADQSATDDETGAAGGVDAPSPGLGANGPVTTGATADDAGTPARRDPRPLPRTTTTLPTTTLPTTTLPTTTVVPLPPATVAPIATVAPATTIAPPAPQPMSPRIVDAVASSTRADSKDGCQPPNPTTYPASQLFDRYTDTAWMTDGAGTGATITFALAGLSNVTTVGLIAGYTKVDPCRNTDRFLELRRVTQVEWTFDDGTSITQMLDPNVREMQHLTFVTPVVTTTVRLTILETTGPGNPTLDYTAISEVDVL